jgi:hypothetical protein
MSESDKKKSITPKSDRKAPIDMDSFFQWQTNRRSLIKAAIIAGTLSQFSFLQSCTDDLEVRKRKRFTGCKSNDHSEICT